RPAPGHPRLRGGADGEPDAGAAGDGDVAAADGAAGDGVDDAVLLLPAAGQRPGRRPGHEPALAAVRPVERHLPRGLRLPGAGPAAVPAGVARSGPGADGGELSMPELPGTADPGRGDRTLTGGRGQGAGA